MATSTEGWTEADAEKQRARRFARKIRLVERLGGECQRCGYNNPVALEFHHRDGSSKAFRISGARLNLAMDVLYQEADKCDLLCANCHREEHTLHDPCGKS